MFQNLFQSESSFHTRDFQVIQNSFHSQPDGFQPTKPVHDDTDGDNEVDRSSEDTSFVPYEPGSCELIRVRGSASGEDASEPEIVSEKAIQH